ncbi:MAG: hypothetical protein ACLS48_08530 [[Eubacterium] siraeum]
MCLQYLSQAININGAAVSTVIMYAAVALGGYFALENVTGIDFHIIRIRLFL